MSQHPSLLGSQKGKGHRSVFKRYEKLKHLMEKDKWDEEDSIYRLPKVKSIRFKVKKEKAAEAKPAEGAAPAGTQAGPVQPQPGQAGAKSAAGQVPPAPKEKKSKT